MSEHMQAEQVVAVIGLGYIGLPTAAILAAHGSRVIGVDVDARRVEAVNDGRVPFVEPELELSLAGAVSQSRLRAQKKVPAADVYIVAVPTPFLDDHAADLSYVHAACDAIAPQLRGGELIILESTSPPGTTEAMAAQILAARPDLDVPTEAPEALAFAHCPERVLPGRIMVELVTNDRIVGGMTPEASERARALYATFCQGQIVVTDARTAELAKLSENAYRDVNIAFANELALISERLGIDVNELITIANHHPRVDILAPGPGVGGHCIAVDPWFIVAAAPQEARMIRSAREVNDAQPALVADTIGEVVRRGNHRSVALLGLSYKPDVDDTRMSPAVEVARRLVLGHPEVEFLVSDPHVTDVPPELAEIANVRMVDLDTASECAVVAVLVGHAAFDRVYSHEGRTVLDSRGLLRRGAPTMATT